MSIEKIRKFNIQGITKATEMYELNKDKFKIGNPDYYDLCNELVSDADLTEELENEALLDTSKNYFTKSELGRAVYDSFVNFDKDKIINDRGLWSWLGLKLINNLVATKRRKVYEYYIFHTMGRANRHLVRDAFLPFYYHSISDLREAGKVLGNISANDHSGFAEQFGRVEFVSSLGILKLTDILYGDSDGNLDMSHPGTRATPTGNEGRDDPEKGGFRAFSKHLEKLRKTKYFQVLGHEELLDLIHPTFKQRL